MTELQTVGERPEPKRDRWGRYLITPPDGGNATSMTRATTVASAVDDTAGLQKWMKRQTALGMAMRPDLVAAVATCDPDDKQALGRLAEQAMDAAGSTAAATIGTALHRATELADLGLDVPEMFAERVAEYRATLEAHGVVIDRDLVECVLVLWEYDIAGTADRIITIGDERYVFDLKTGESIHPHGFAIQLAIYAAAQNIYDVATDSLKEMPEVNQDRAIICHLPAKGGPCTLHWIDIAAGREALEHALWVRDWRKRKDLLEAFPVPAVANEERPTTELLTEAFGAVTVDVDETAALQERRRALILERLPEIIPGFWKANLPGIRGPKAADEWSDADMDRIEAVYELPFDPPPLPATEPPEPVADVVELRPRPSDELGPAVDADSLTDLRERARRQSNGVKAWISTWNAEAIDEGHAWKMGRGKHVSEWSYECSRAGLYLARIVERAESPETGLDLVRRLLATVLGPLAVADGVTIGGAIAALCTEEARQLADLSTEMNAKQIEAAS